MKKNLLTKSLSISLSMALVLSSSGINSVNANATSEDNSLITNNMEELTDEDVLSLTESTDIARTSVHDPSIVTDKDGTYYVFGSHMGVSKSENLVDWTSVYSESVDSTLFGNSSGDILSYEDAFCTNAYTGNVTVRDDSGNTYEASFGSYDIAKWISDNTIQGNMWAPDVIYNDTIDKWCMYLSLNGATWNSSIVLLTSDDIEGPYVYQGPVLFSGFSTQDSSKSYKDTDLELVIGETDTLPSKYDKISDSSFGTYWPHAIDPCVFYDDDGNLYMSYGSWSGGIYILELDENTGLRDYTVSYEDTYDTLGASVTSDPYYGIKLGGGYYVSGEGSYIQKIGDYYYMFLSYGFYDPDGGYNMRVFRSESPAGPYVDVDGNSAIFNKYIMNYSSTNSSNNIGLKIMGNYKWDTMTYAEVAQGHNSAFTDANGNSYLVYHTKFNDGTSGHSLRVHKLYLNSDNWIVAAPYEYSGTSYDNTSYDTSEVYGTYNVIVHKYQVDYANLEYVSPEKISLNEDGSISGAYEGSYFISEGSNYINITLDGSEYTGVVTTECIDNTSISNLCFSAVNSDGLCIWGSRALSEQLAIAQSAITLDINLPKSTYTDLDLVTTGLDGVSISYTSSNPEIISNDGVIINRPLTDTQVTYTQTFVSGNYYYEKEYDIIIRADQQNTEDTVLLGSYYTDSSLDLSSCMNGETYVGNPFHRDSTYGLDLSGGVNITFDVESTGDLHMLGTIFAFLADGGDSGRLYFTPGSYLGYNASGNYFDANMTGYSLVEDYIGDSANVSLTFTPSGFTVEVNGEIAYTQEILDTDAGSKSITDYSAILTWLYNSADTLSFGYGSWWSAEGYDEANCNISNIYCYALPIVESDSTISYDDIIDITDEYTLTSAADITVKDNPFYNASINSLYVEYTIDFDADAAKNGWDGIFSFYNSTTGGRISFQTAPYICYNDNNGNWIDINQPGTDGATNSATSMAVGINHTVSLAITSNGAVAYVDGESIDMAVTSSGASYGDLIEYITTCDTLTLGVGAKETAYWETEICTVSNLILSSREYTSHNSTIPDTDLLTAEDINTMENPLAGTDSDAVYLDFNINFDSDAKNGWDGVFSFYDTLTGARVSIQTAPYICYNNGNGSYMDINSPLNDNSTNMTQDLLTGVDYNYTILITRDYLKMYLDGESIDYTVDGPTSDYSELIDLINSCDSFTIGTGNAVSSYWNTEICSLSDISLNGYTFCANETDSIDTVTEVDYTLDSIVLDDSSDITIIDNPLYGSDALEVLVEYTINFSEDAIMNGWDGILSFYETSTAGRVSFQTAPYICYNDNSGNYIDINKPDSGINILDSMSLTPSKDYTFTYIITKSGVDIYLDGVKLDLAQTDASASYDDMINYLSTCDSLSFGVGTAQTSYWNTELCTLSNIKISTNIYPSANIAIEQYSLEQSSIEYMDNPLYGSELSNLYIDYTINLDKDAAKNGYDGIFSFYNSSTLGRVSFQTAPYICYNDSNGNYIDVNHPVSMDSTIATLLTGVDYNVSISISSSNIEMSIDGKTIDIVSTDTDYSKILKYISECDKFTLGVGEGVSSYWWTEKCTVSNLTISPVKLTVQDSEGGSVVCSDNVYTANALDGYEFAGWYNNNTLISDSISITPVICKDTAITALYEKVPVFSAVSEVTSTYNNTSIINVTITNISDSTLKSPSFAFSYDGTIKSMWGASFVNSTDTDYIVSVPAWNKNLDAGESFSFSFIADYNNSSSDIPYNYELISYEDTLDESSYNLAINKICSFNSQSIYSMVFTNQDIDVMNNWTIEFDYDGEINNIWGAHIVSHIGNHYILEPESYNISIAPLSSILIGFSSTDNIDSTFSNISVTDIKIVD